MPLATTNSSKTAAVVFDSQRLALQHGIDFDLDDPDVEDEGEEQVDYDDESSEVIQAFADQHISLQPAVTNRWGRASKPLFTFGSNSTSRFIKS